jgi:outer membrane protein OmpA-like peptidoglycan-associated protein
MIMIRPFGLLLASVCVALLIAGCAKHTTVAGATPSPQTAIESPGPSALSASESPSPSALSARESPGPSAPNANESPQAEASSPTPSATPTGPVNLLTFAQGTITRKWPPTDRSVFPNAFLFGPGYAWQSKPGAAGPFVFVFELAAPAEIDSLGFTAYSQDTAHAAQSVRVESSTQGADTGYSDIGNYKLKDSSSEQDFPLSQPATARWLRITIAQRTNDFTSLQSVFAYGKPQPRQPKSLTGVWLEDNGGLVAPDDPLFAGDSLTTTPDPKLVDKQYELVQIVEHDGILRAGRCHPNGATMVGVTFGGTQSGATVTWQDVSGNGIPASASVVNAEGTMMIGPLYDMMIRLQPGPTCTKVEPPVGSGKNVLILTPDGRYTNYYYPAQHVDKFPGFRFTPLAFALLTPESFIGIDTVVMDCVDKASQRIAPWQATALTDFVSAGHKLIIYDADKCGTLTAYSFLPYRFETSNPGANGAASKNLYLVESDTLGSDKTDPQHFFDVRGFLAESNQQIGDSNTVTTQDPHWCGHLFGTNVLGVNGFMQMYAVLGRGLIIYDGFDQDTASLPEQERLVLLELRQPVPALLPCSVTVASKFLIAPSQQLPFTPGRTATMTIPLQVFAVQGFAGNVALLAKAPVDAPWKTALSTAQVALKSNTAPVNLMISVPATAAAGDHEFYVNGDDGQGHTASARIVLISAPPQRVVNVKPVKKGCTERLTMGADALFEFGEAALTHTAQKTLAALGPTIKAAGKHPVRINGYTDSIGADAYNLVLSEERARSVRDWLAAHGYVKASTPIQGFGKQQPVAPNANPDGSDNPQGRAKNRRVEVLIDTCR